MLRVEFKLIGAEELEKLGRVDLTPTMALVAEVLVGAVNDEFESNGRGKWPDLADSTKARKVRHGRDPGKMLFWNGFLTASIEGDYGPDWAAAQTGVAYAVYHVSKEPRTKIPQRDFFDVDPRTYDEAEQLILAALVGAR